MRRRSTLVAALACLSLSGCLDGLFGTQDAGGIAPAGAGVGASCERDNQCRPSLRCDTAARVCALRGDSIAGANCVLTGECSAGLFCNGAGVCATAGAAADGESCGDTASCQRGLVCARPTGELFGLCRAPRGASPGDAGSTAGTARDIDGPCADLLDCQAGLDCHPTTRTCYSAAVTAAFAGRDGGATLWPGERCAAEEDGPARAYFELPAMDGAPPHDFFRLPYPNDVRRDPATGRINLTGFPHPGTALLGFDLIDRYLRAIERSVDGFGTNQLIYFRFSGRLDFATLRLNDTLRLIDLTTGQPTGTVRYAANTAGNRYLCGNPVMIDTGHGAPMEPGHTYAALVMAGVRDASGRAVERDADFPAMLAEAAPADPLRARAHSAYAPLRRYLASERIDPATVIVATVFTTQQPRRVVPALREAVRAATAPAPEGFVRCDTGVRSPCDDGLAGADHVRGCIGPADPAFDELQGTLSLPYFQSGARPYREPGSGAIAVDATGRPMAQGSERVCVTITVPRGAGAPAGGWPTVLYAHGTGGSYRSVVGDGLAGALSGVDLGGGATVRFATVGFEGVMHGARRGMGVSTPPDQAFFNFGNPEAARDNVLQGSADLFSMVRALSTVTLPMLPREGQSVRFDPRRIFFFGHSQGSTVGLPAAAYEPDLAGMVFSGAGGDLRLSLTSKVRPIDIASLVPAVLQDPDARGAGHPALNILQTFFERSDAVNYGRLVLLDRPMGIAARPVLMTYGLGDSYSPTATMQTVAATLGLPAAGTIPGGANAWPSGAGLPFPVMNNLAGTTAALLEVDPGSAYDGHFVVFRDRQLNERVLRFLATAAQGAAVIR
ncbi:MAG: hypothetical protein EPO40_09770 [Myxococcaceae bacterium]|nr:MAG: hypothetical protein EPO40_09770 [Myxococcaceae bacterium]